MTKLVIPDVEEFLLARLNAQAAAHECSVEEEARRLLRQALPPAQPSPPARFDDAMRTWLAPLGGMELPLPDRDEPRTPPDFSGPARNMTWHTCS